MVHAHAEEALIWLGLFAGLGGLVLRTVLVTSTTLQSRWILFAFILGLPCLCPSRGLLSTFLTGLCVVFAARLPDLEHERLKLSPAKLALWLLVPIFRERPNCTPAKHRENAKRSALSAAKNLVSAALFVALLRHADGAQAHFLLRSSALILFFVWLLVGLSDVLIALLELGGLGTEPVFDEPLRSRSVREFWSRRWNRFIARFALRHIALTNRSGRGASALRRTWVVFLWSSLFHEYFAWGVAGSHTALFAMTLFFLLQAGLLEIIRLGEGRFDVPARVGQSLTFGWMTLTAPLFFQAVHTPLLTLGFPPTWLPNWLLPTIVPRLLF
jgi:hypothetical protein